jgi:ERCC4-related helicase
MEHTPFPGEYLYNDTMRRIQKIEDLATDFTTHIATEELRFTQISNQIEELGDKLGGAIEGLSDRVDSLAVVTNSHTAQLQDVLEVHQKEKQASETRKRWGWKILAIVGIPLTAALGRFGEMAWEYWFSK